MDNDTPKAFPLHIDSPEYIAVNEGMDLRDYFAAKAMQVAMDSIWTHDGGEVHDDSEEAARNIAKQAYLIADAMLAAREEK